MPRNDPLTDLFPKRDPPLNLLGVTSIRVTTGPPAEPQPTLLGMPMVASNALPQDTWVLVPNPRTCPNCGGTSLHMTGLGYDECQACGHRIVIQARVHRVSETADYRPGEWVPCACGAAEVVTDTLGNTLRTRPKEEPDPVSR